MIFTILARLVGVTVVACMFLCCTENHSEDRPLVSVCNLQTSGLVLPDSTVDWLSDRLAARITATGKFRVVDRKLTNAHGSLVHERDLYLSCQDQSCLVSFMAGRAHAVIQKRAADFEDYSAVRDKVLNHPGVASVIPFILNEAIVSNDMGFAPVILEGISPDMVGFLTGLPPTKEKTGAGLYLGRELASRLRVRAGDKVHLISPLNMQENAEGMYPKTRSFEINGIFNTGVSETDDKSAFTTFEAAQDFFERGKTATGLWIVFDDLSRAGTLAKELVDSLGGYPYFARTWLEWNRELFQTLAVHPVDKDILSHKVVITHVRKRKEICTLNVALFDRKKIRFSRSVVIPTGCTESEIAKNLDTAAGMLTP
jgi:hypothetical protein